MFDFLQGLPDPAVRAITLVAALFPLVLVHEFGHFLLAKLNKIRVEEFGIGFPPRLVRLVTFGGTDYTLNWLPIGGFVRLAGEDNPDLPDSFASKSKRARSAVLLAGPIANFLLAALIFVLVAVPEEIPAVRGVSVAGFSAVAGTAVSPAQEAGLLPYDIIVAVDGQALATGPAADRQAQAQDTLEALQARTNAHTGRPMRLPILRDVRVVPVSPPTDGLRTEASEVPGVTGQRVAGGTGGSDVQVGDILFDAAGVSGIRDGRTLALRGLTALDLTVTPLADGTDGKGRMGVQISPAVVPLALPPMAAIGRGLMLTGVWMQAMVEGLAKMLVGQERLALAGPVKISEMSRDVSNQGADKFLLFMALLSINLGIINLLPIPALDGGRLLFIAAEAIRGRRVEPAREAVVHFVGFVVVIGLMIVLTAFELLHIGRP